MSFAVPGQVIEIHGVRNNRLGLVRFGETVRPIFLDLVPEAGIGDYVTVHVGFATGVVTAQEAERAYDRLRASGELGTAELDLQLEEAKPDMRRRQKPR
jgi:hydrogenase expression/formation protein HypC